MRKKIAYLIWLQRLYELGARKFAVSGVGVIGCYPGHRKQDTNSKCNANANYWSMKYNDGLKTMMHELKQESSDFYYSYFKMYDVMNKIISQAETYGT